MLNLLTALIVPCLMLAAVGPAFAAEEEKPKTALDHKMKNIRGETVDLSKYKGKAVLIVNTASECGYTPQYEGLQKLHDKYAEKGLAILGFPSNQFGGQEPGDDEEIARFCEENYGVEFDMFSKIDVNGENAAPLYKYLTSKEAPVSDKGEIKWNFEKFLIDREGNVVARFRSKAEPTSEEMVQAIEKELEQEQS